jgi:hypothetical protein
VKFRPLAYTILQANLETTFRKFLSLPKLVELFQPSDPAPCTQICHHGFLAKSLTIVPVSLQAMPRQLRGPTPCCRFGLLICSLQVAQEMVSLQYALISVVSTPFVQTDALGATLDGHVICPFTFLTIGIDARQILSMSCGPCHKVCLITYCHILCT